MPPPAASPALPRPQPARAATMPAAMTAFVVPIREPPDDAARRPVPRGVLLRVFLRALLVQTGFNPRTMQGPGYAFAVYPALRWLYPPGEAREAAVRRHAGHFNTHPTFAAALIGGAVRIEERIAAGLAPESSAERFRSALAAPLAALGDAFFWNALRPACALAALLTAPLLGAWAAVLFLVLYDAVHLPMRVWLFLSGYRHAEGLVQVVGRARLPWATRRLQRAGAVLAGGTLAGAVLVSGQGGGATALAAAVGAGVGLLAGGRFSPLLLAGLVLATALGAGLLL